MPKLVLTDADRTAILNAPDDESTADLSRRLGRPYRTVHEVRRQIRRTGWSCQLTVGTCDTCGETLLIPPQSHGMRRHRNCDVEHDRQRLEQRRHDDDTFRAAINARSRQRQKGLQSVTMGLDRASRQRWTPEDDDYLWEHRGQVYTAEGIAQLADTLGRSFAACQTRLTRLAAQRERRR